MNKQDLEIGQKVKFGRENGEQTLGKIVKLNPTKAKIQIIEDRGNGRGSVPGSFWGVPYSLIHPADSTEPVKEPELKYNPYAHLDNLILEAIATVYSNLSPEHLTADGERPRLQVRALKASLERQLKGLCLAYGSNVSETQAINWHESKRQYMHAHNL
jgi:hypothetical protein